MSKVVHLSDTAHAKAKTFCKQNRLRMSDWVAALIDEAVSLNRTDTSRAAVPKKKVLPDLTRQTDEEVPAYAAPPFWVKGQAKGG